MSERDKKNGKNENNISRIGRIISISGSVDSLLDRGDDMFDKGDSIGALKLYRRALRLRPNNDDIRLRVTDTLLDMGCFSEAMSVLSPSLVQGSQILRLVIYRLAHCMLGRGEFRAAKQLFLLSVADGGEDDASDELNYEETANAFDCIAICDQYLESEKDEKRFVRDFDELEVERALEAADKLSEQGKFDESIPLAEKAYASHPESLDALTALLLNYYCDRRLADGKKLYESAPKRFQNDFKALCSAALIYNSLGEDEKAAKLVSIITAQDLEQVNDIVRAYTVMMEIGRFEKAAEYAGDLCDIEPFNRSFLHFAAQAVYCLNDISYAKQFYERCLVIEPWDSVAHYYKQLCIETLETGERAPYRIEYNVPPSEFLSRVERSEEISNMSGAEVKELYTVSRDEILRLTDWSMNDPSCPYGDMYLSILEHFDPELAESLARRIMVDPSSTKLLRQSALMHLNSLAPNEKFMLYSDGNVNVCSFGNRLSSYEDWPESYRKIAELVCSRLADKASELVPGAARLCYLYALDNYKSKPRLPYGQAEAMAAAIEYFLLREDDRHETPELHSFAAERGVTVRRIENALVRLLSIRLPEGFASEDGASTRAPDLSDLFDDEDEADETAAGRIAELIRIREESAKDGDDNNKSDDGGKDYADGGNDDADGGNDEDDEKNDGDQE